MPATPTEPVVHRPYERYTPAKGEAVCAMIAQGLTLDEIEQTPGYPPKRTILEWVTKRADFARAYLVARQIQVDALTDRGIRAVAELVENRPTGPDGEPVPLSKEEISVARAKSEAYFRAAQLRRPRSATLDNVALYGHSTEEQAGERDGHVERVSQDMADRINAIALKHIKPRSGGARKKKRGGE